MTTTELRAAFRDYFAGKLTPEATTDLLRTARKQDFIYSGSRAR